jgi:hypothetical protein
MSPLRAPVPSSRADLIGLLLVAAGPIRMSPHCWPLEVALEQLDATLGGRYSLGSVLARWPRLTSSSGRTFEGVGATFRELVSRGDLVVVGTGSSAGFELTVSAQPKYFRQLAWLSDPEAAAVRRSVQRLAACLSTLSKKSRASSSVGSFTT